jgi:putative ABC transport system ATP-binding protein
MIEITDLEFHYGRDGFRLRLPHLVLESGSKVAIIGPSGSGKTTFLNLVSGICTPHRGSVRVNGTAVSDLSDSARRTFRITNIGFVFQDFELIEFLTIRDNVLYPFRLNRALCLTAEVRRRAEQLANETGLGETLERRPDQLSQGERQRAAICRALVTEPKLLLADEPTGNLDPDNKERILDLLMVSAERSGATLIVVTHDRSLLDRFDRVLDFRELGCGAKD